MATALGTLLLSRLVLIVQSPRAFRTYPALLLSLPTVSRFGLLLALVSGCTYMLAARLPWLRTLDAVAPAALLFTAFLHLGSFFAGTDTGAVTSLRIGGLIPGQPGSHPVALYAAALSLLCTATAFGVLVRQRRPGACFGVALALVAIGRFIADEFRPSYVLPNLYLAGTHLRIDQVVLIALAAGGMLLLMERPHHAQ